jgi:hypothetical protein
MKMSSRFLMTRRTLTALLSLLALRVGAAEPAVPVRVSAAGTQTFFGYYDVAAVDARTGRHLAHRAPFRDRMPGPEDEVELGVIAPAAPGEFQPFARTKAWNFQQGAMLQWLGDGTGRVFYNEVNPAGGYRGVLHDLATGQRQHTDRALANVSLDGHWGLAVDFDRLHDFRPGYGYAAQPDARANVLHPADDGVWVCDLTSGRSRLVLSLATLHARVGALSPLMEQKLLINHLTFNPSATRFVLLLRNFPAAGPRLPGKSAWLTTVLTAARDGSDLHLIVPPGYASHYHWRDDHILVFHSDGPQGKQLYEVTDEAQPRFTAIDPAFFLRDGHCTYSADRSWMLYDSYPDESGRQHLYVYDLQQHRGRELGAFKVLPVPVIDVRCDLHPRWLPDGRVSFDSTHEGYRGLYVIDPGTRGAP